MESPCVSAAQIGSEIEPNTAPRIAKRVIGGCIPQAFSIARARRNSTSYTQFCRRNDARSRRFVTPKMRNAARRQGTPRLPYRELLPESELLTGVVHATRD